MGYLKGHLNGSKVLEDQMVLDSAEARKMEAENILMQLRHTISAKEIELKTARKRWSLGEIKFRSIVDLHASIIGSKELYDAVAEEVRLAVEDDPKEKSKSK